MCENVLLLPKGFNKCKKLTGTYPTYPHDLVEKYSCKSNSKECMFNKCTTCDSDTFHVILNLDECTSDDSNSDSDNSEAAAVVNISYYKWQKGENDKVAKIKITQPFEEAVELLKDGITELKEHIMKKRIQNSVRQNMMDSLGGERLIASR